MEDSAQRKGGASMKTKKSEVDVLVKLQALMLAHSMADAARNAQLMELVVDDHLRVTAARLTNTRTPPPEGDSA